MGTSNRGPIGIEESFLDPERGINGTAKMNYPLGVMEHDPSFTSLYEVRTFKKGGKKKDKPKNYFDITKLFPVFDEKKWSEGKKYMEFWADGEKCVALPDKSKKDDKSTIGANVDHKCMRIYTIEWNWLNKFHMASTSYQEMKSNRIKNEAVKKVITKNYGKLVPTTGQYAQFGESLYDGMLPEYYRPLIKKHQMQYLSVPGENDPDKMTDLTAALHGFAFYAMYKGRVYNHQKFKESAFFENLNGISKEENERLFDKLISGDLAALIYVSDAAIYAGDIYEFNGNQYLATWDIENLKVDNSLWDYLWGTSDTDDPTGLSITNETFRRYRRETGKGGDFLALSPIKLVSCPMLIPVK